MTSKLFTASITAFVCIGLIALCGYVRNTQILLACKIGAFIFALITSVVLSLVIMDALNERVRVMTDFIDSFGKLDDEARAAVAFEFPSMRYVMKGGRVREMFENTQATVEQFREFLASSNERQVSPRRDWCTREKPEWAWSEIMDHLMSKGYVLEDSYAGNHSWLWRGNAYRHLMAYWLAGRKVVDMNAEEAI